MERTNGAFLDGARICVSHYSGVNGKKETRVTVKECFDWRASKSCSKGNRCKYAHMTHNGAISRDMRFEKA